MDGLFNLVADPRVLVLAFAALLAGLVRGFTGFGAGMVFIPVATAVYDPVMAVTLLFIIDAVTTTPMLLPHFRACTWREVLPLALGGTLAFPLGLTFMLSVDPAIVRWGLSAFVMLVVVAMATGWRYPGNPTRATALGVGGGMGFLSGAIGLGGPLVILFWLAGRSQAALVRSNIFAFFGLMAGVTLVGFFWKGFFTAERLWLGALLVPLYAIPLLVGSRMFQNSSDTQYRRAALALCGVVAIATLPIW